MNFRNAWLNWSTLPDMILLHYYVSRQIFFFCRFDQTLAAGHPSAMVLTLLWRPTKPPHLLNKIGHNSHGLL